MDPFDEFEMKPLTEGLGFHKKAIKMNKDGAKSASNPLNLQETPKASAKGVKLALENDKKALEKIMATLDTPTNRKLSSLDADGGEVHITETLPREEAARSALDIERTPVAPSTPARPTARPVARPGAATVGVRRGAHDATPLERLKPAPVSLSSAFLDSLVVLALSLVFLMALLMVTKVNLLVVAGNARTDLTTQLSFALLYLAVMQMYVVITRSFFGKTLGEWTFDFQMGSQDQIKKGYYPLLVVWRSILIVMTGVIVFPVLSLISRRDLASYFTGLQLYRRV